jgi:peptidoglycan/LPS O-acetylase OafA/YrhL
MQRIKELDSIRGLAALVIVFHHLWFPRFSVLGSAVDLFFVLSAYLITTIIFCHAPTDRFLLSFYIRRGLRIWPIYYVLLLFLVMIYPYLPPSGTLGDLPYYLTFTQELPRYHAATGPTFPSAFRHTWSLAIEEQFYLIWPLALVLVGRRGLPFLATALLGLAAASRLLRLSDFILITHCDGLALGGWLAVLDLGRKGSAAASERLRSQLVAIGCAAVALFAGTLVLGSAPDAGGLGIVPAIALKCLKPLFLNLAFFALLGTIVLHAGLPRLAWLRDRRLVYLGSMSYGIYLYHHFIFEIFKYYEYHFRWETSVSWDLGKVALALGVASLSWRYLERPILSLKDRFGYQPAVRAGLEPGREVDELRGAQVGS